MEWGFVKGATINVNFDGDESQFFDGGWSEVGGNTLNDKIVLGGELVVNGNFANWTGDDPDGWTVAGEVGADPEISQVGAGQGHGGVGLGLANMFATAVNTLVIRQTILTIGGWYQWTIDIDSVTIAGIVRYRDEGNGILIVYSTPGSKLVTGRSGGTRLEIGVRNKPVDITIDNSSANQLTLISILNALKSQFGLADGFFIDVHINAVTTDTQVGVIWNLDDAATPANFGMAYMDGTYLVVDKNVNGIYSNLASVTQAVTPDQILRIENPAGTNALSIKYNGVEKATPTIADASVIGNTGIALFSTEASNAISKVTIGKL